MQVTPTPLTDALIAKLDAEHRTNLVFVIRQIVNHAKEMERAAVVGARSESSASPSRLARAIFSLNAATIPVDSFGNPNIKVVRRDEAEAILREAMGGAE